MSFETNQVVSPTTPQADVFDRRAWLYALCRDHLFMDHTALVAQMLQAHPASASAPVFLELGCGPGFYASRLAHLLPAWQTLGVDQSPKLIERARQRNLAGNCSFHVADVLQLELWKESVDFVFASRLLLILRERRRALLSAFSTLRQGGTLLLAEPRAGWRTSLALAGMGLLSSGETDEAEPLSPYHPEPVRMETLESLLAELPCVHRRCWTEARYHFALCRKEGCDETKNNAP